MNEMNHLYLNIAWLVRSTGQTNQTRQYQHCLLS